MQHRRPNYRLSKLTWAPALLGAWIAGCQAEAVHDLGTARRAQDVESVPAEPFFTGAGAEAFVGRWLGEADDPLGLDPNGVYRFPSGATQILLDFTSPDRASAVLTFGAGTPPPPPSDRDAGYPEDVDYLDLISYIANPDSIAPSHPLPPYEGYPYSASRAIAGDEVFVIGDELIVGDVVQLGLADGVLKLDYDTSSFIDPWCRLQTPYEHPDGTYDCLPPNDGYPQPLGDGRCDLVGPSDRNACPANLDELPMDEFLATLSECEVPGPLVATVDCDKAFLCATDRLVLPGAPLGLCICDAEGCYGNDRANRATLSLRAHGDELVGAFGGGAAFINERGLSVQLGTVRFRRAD